MGGLTFEKTVRLNKIEYDKLTNYIASILHEKNLNYLIPFRLANKDTYGDIDIILYDVDKFIDLFDKSSNNEYKILKIKTIPLFEKRFNQFSKHILTSEFYQIDLLKSWNSESIEITRAYYSYSFANIFFKRIINIVDRNLSFSYLGVLCTSNKYIIPLDVKFKKIDNNTRLIIDCKYIFGLMDLDYDEFINGFENEIELLEYLKKSKFFLQVKFKLNSKFIHDYQRLKPFANLVDLGLITMDN